ncbi:MAG: hypothetical protein AB1749_03470 [Pseudomonadota bacterium]
MRVLGLVPVLAILAPAAAWAGTPAAPSPLVLEPGRAVEISCEGKAVVVATGAPQATTGRLRLSLLAAEPQRGTWRIVSVDPGHAGSLGAREAKACAEGCPLVVSGTDQIQLWSPAPKGLDQLAEKEMLLIAVLKTATLDLRATSFNGKQIEALEEGRCEVAP